MDANQIYSNGEMKPKAPVLSIIGLVCGILSIVLLLCCCCFGGVFGSWGTIIFGLAGIICSFLGNKNQKTGVGTAGLICSIVGLLCGIGCLVLGIFGLIFNVAGNSFLDYLN